MSVADSFTALGAGNGFPWCVTESAPDSDAIQSGLTLSQMMALYWNVESVRVVLDLTVNWEYGFESGGVYTYDTGSDSWFLDETWNVRENSAGTTFSGVEPKNRTCDYQDIGPSGCSRGLISNIDVRVAPTVGTISKQGGAYSLGLSGAGSIGPVSGSDPLSGESLWNIQLYENNNPYLTTPNFAESKAFNPYIESKTAFLNVRESNTKPFTGLRYASHTWTDFQVIFGFHTYA